MQSYVTAFSLLLVLAPALAGAVLTTCALTFFRPKPIKGWRPVTPGLGYWTALVLSLALFILIGWVWAFIGSSRADGAFQMRIAWWLAFAFSCGAAFAGQRILRLSRQGLRWRGDVVAWNGSGGSIPITSLASLRSDVFGFARAHFVGGQRLSVDLAAAGATDLIERIEDLNGLAPEARPGDH